MKVRSAIKRICGFCQIIRRGKILYVRCQKNNRHKQRQGFGTLDSRFKLGDRSHCECPEIKIMNSSLIRSQLIEDNHKCNDNCGHINKKDDKNNLDFLDELSNKLI